MAASTKRHTLCDFALLGGFGTLVAHEVAYAPISVAKAAVPHAHLPMLWAIISPLALGGVGYYVVRSLRGRPGSHSVNSKHLAMAMLLGFLGMELTERSLGGVSVSGFVAEPVMWIGLLVVPAVAVVLARMVDTAVEVITRWIALPEADVFVALPASLPSHARRSSYVVASLGYSQNRRGPPNRIVR